MSSRHGQKRGELVVDDWRTDNGDTVEIYRAEGTCDNPGCDLAHYVGDYRWRVRAGNGEVVGQGEGHPRRSSAVAAAERHHPPVTE
jgi:hypothetical protein